LPKIGVAIISSVDQYASKSPFLVKPIIIIKAKNTFNSSTVTGRHFCDVNNQDDDEFGWEHKDTFPVCAPFTGKPGLNIELPEKICK
jgi:hypothetical protein